MAALGDAGLGQVLDIVPNHMAITGPENRWWWDVLEHGPSSPWAGHFDVTWDPPEEKLRNTVLLPILGDHYGRVLDRGEVTIERDGARFLVRYFDHVLPVAPRSLGGLLADAAARAGDDDLDYVARGLPPPAAGDPHRPGRRWPSATATPRSCGASWPGCSTSDPTRGPRSTPRSPISTATSTPSTPCSSSRTTASPTGAPPSASWATAGSSTSTRSSACGSRTPTSSPTPTS